MRRALVIAAALTASVTLAPTSAHAGTVDRLLVNFNVKVGDGYVATAVCRAEALPDPGEFTALTSVTCRINGFSSPTVTAPGSHAATAVANATSSPITVCIDASATFASPTGLPYTVSVINDCRRVLG